MDRLKATRSDRTACVARSTRYNAVICHVASHDQRRLVARRLFHWPLQHCTRAPHRKEILQAKPNFDSDSSVVSNDKGDSDSRAFCLLSW
eukprot:6480926-Amphidinium_carterae.1